MIDCDPGHDDLVAILYGAVHCRLVGITTVHGNHSVDRVTDNALRICELAGLDVPVARGMARPWVAEPVHAPAIHGESGLDGASLPSPRRSPESRHAVEFILEQSHRFPGLVLAALGPLTNVATALRLDPSLGQRLRAITLMGGSTTGGNVTPAAEFNVYADPEAAHAVFGSGIPLYMVGLNVTRQVGVGPAEVERLRRQGGRVAQVVADLLDYYRGRLAELFGLASGSLHDPCALVPFIVPGLIRYEPMHVGIELSRSLTRGMTVCDYRHAGRARAGVPESRGTRGSAPPNAQVAVEVQASELVDHILETLCSYP